MRRTISMILAAALIAGGIFWFAWMLLYSERIYFKFVLGAGFMIGVGAYWLWIDFIDATPNRTDG